MTDGAGIGSALRARYRDILASVYLYNEHRGYTALDRVLAAVRRVCPDDVGFIAAIAHHRADEHKHYHMFRRWFERQGTMPLALDRAAGHIDRFVLRTFGCTIDALETEVVVADPGAFEALCRVIVLTEQRGLRQVEVLLAHPWVRSDPVLRRIFAIIHRDEPSHFLPYLGWLERRGRAAARWRERWSDLLIHRQLVLGHLPALFLDPALPRLTHWPHETDPIPEAAA